ncbi:MAG: hypothetical protein EOP10_14150 [Proteobacteria bacterium]|nr:MAG: hypothetical protein EOP10_14150 [Pseudomonadota bacterium]
MRIRSLLGAAALVSQLFAFPLLADTKEWTDKGWEFVGEKEGIKTYLKNYANSPVKGVGGEAEIDAPIGKILWVLMDHEHKNQWIDKFKEARTIDEVSPLTHIQYASFDMPFPVSDREFVYSFDFSVDPKLNAVVVDVKSVDSPKAPAVTPGNVRGEIIDGRYILKPHGDKTYVQAEYLADAKGSLPVWVVNMVQKSWPHKTLDNLRRQVKKDFVKSWNYYDSDLKPKLKLD